MYDLHSTERIYFGERVTSSCCHHVVIMLCPSSLLFVKNGSVLQWLKNKHGVSVHEGLRVQSESLWLWIPFKPNFAEIKIWKWPRHVHKCYEAKYVYYKEIFLKKRIILNVHNTNLVLAVSCTNTLNTLGTF